MNPLTHWQRVYRERMPEAVSWYEAVPWRSLHLIRATGVDPNAPVVIVGGGSSTLVDHLLDDGFGDITVLDIAPAALEIARKRLGPAAAGVTWLAEDILSFRPKRRFALWLDRAVLHFLVDPPDQQRYLASLRASLQDSGHVILATFGPEGPTSCSGLPVQRYSADTLGALLGPAFVLRESHLDTHITPAGSTQQFMSGRWQRISEGPPLTPVV